MHESESERGCSSITDLLPPSRAFIQSILALLLALAATACGDVSGTVQNLPDIDVEPLEIEYGTVDYDAPATRAFTVYNTGAGTLDVSALSITQPPTGTVFSVTSDDVPDPFRFALSGGQSATFELRFQPLADIDYVGAVVINCNDTNEKQVTIRVHGVGSGAPTPTPEPETSPTPGGDGEDNDHDGYTEQQGDCDDGDASIHPGANESCDGADNDCDEDIDEGLASATWYPDEDSDGYGATGASIKACSAPSGYLTTGGDCDDTDPDVHPGAVEQPENGQDDDCDGTTDEGGSGFDDDHDGYSEQQGDCDDADPTRSPGVTEQCNGKDDDCDGATDEEVKLTFHADMDADGYGNPASATQACEKPSGYVADATDCDDTDASIHPGRTESCNAIDDNCNGTVDEGVKTTFYADTDSDGYGNAASSIEACSRPSGYVSDDTDCNDASASIHPGAAEQCNEIDDNCSGLADEGLTIPTWYYDGDQDGFGDPAATTQACAQPAGYVADKTDCDDASAVAYPGAAEVCNTYDDDCDGTVDEGVKDTFYADADGDGYGASSGSIQACAAPDGYVAQGGDCNDSSPSINPGAPEQCNSLDDDCDGTVDDSVKTSTWYKDQDGDGYGNTSSSTTACKAPTGYVAGYGDCDDTDPSVNPKADDDPDDLFEDTNCDGIDGDEDIAVFVSTQTGDDGNSGTRDEPMKTLGAALAFAKGIFPYLLVADGIYTENLQLVDGVSIYGGYDLDWKRSNEQGVRATLRGTGVAWTAYSVYTVVYASGLKTEVVLDRLEIEGTDAPADRSSYGLYLVSSNSVTVRYSQVSAGAGGAGSKGGNGSKGLTGRTGGNGGDSTYHDDSGSECGITSTRPVAGTGGSGGTTGGSGGKGGQGGYYLFSNPKPYDPDGEDGYGGSVAEDNSSTGGGGGGPGGVYNYVDGKGSDGEVGKTGTVGVNGSGGAGGSTTVISATTSGYSPAHGSAGGNAKSGGGGGGGGGGGAGTGVSIYTCNAYGASGGGGGEGGGPGTPASGGKGGGGSITVFMYSSTATFVSSTLVSRAGGTGGAGGVGGAGGDPGKGGTGGKPLKDTFGDQFTGAGGAGGVGGKGGYGGNGGGGAGGPSVNVLYNSASKLNTQNVTRQNAGTQAAGGTGGSQSGTPSGSSGSPGIIAGYKQY